MTTLTATLGGKPVTIHFGHDAERVTEGSPGLYGLDVESTYLTDPAQFDPDFRVRMVQFATEDNAWVLDMFDMRQQEAAAFMLNEPAFSFASHTNMDVLAVATSLSVDITGRNLDTRMLASMVYTSKFDDRDLKTLCTKLIGPELEDADVELSKWMRDRWIANGGRKAAAKADVERDGWNALATMPFDELPAVFLRYAGLDAVAARRLAPILTAMSKNPSTLLVTDQWLAVRANRMQIIGKRVDVPRLNAQLDTARSEVGAAQADIKATAGLPAGSPYLQKWLGEHGADWDEWEGNRTPKGDPSLAKENLKLVGNFDLDDEGRTVFNALTRHRAQRDMLTKTEDIAKRLVGDRIHPLLNTVGATTTARMSSSGPNMQNMSKKNPLMRGLFLPDEGNDLWTIDFDQVELRVVAALAREDKMIDTILAGGDLHQLTVDELAALGVDITRQQAKVANFLIVYGGGGKALHEQTGVPLELAYEVVRGIRERYPRIDALTQYMGMKKEEVRTISGRRLPVSRDAEGRVKSYANVNYLVQSSARELLADAWIRFEREKGHDGIVWWPVHDELVLQLPVGDESLRQQIIADAEDAMTFDFMGVPISASAIHLIDETGTSRWMPGDIAEKIAKEKAA